jgi:hypothetical protein
MTSSCGGARYAALDEHNIVRLMLPEAPPQAIGRPMIATRVPRRCWRRGREVLTRDPMRLCTCSRRNSVADWRKCVRRGLFGAVKAEGYEPAAFGASGRMPPQG